MEETELRPKVSQLCRPDLEFPGSLDSNGEKGAVILCVCSSIHSFLGFFLRQGSSVCSLDCPGALSVEQAGLELRVIPAFATTAQQTHSL